MKTIISLYYCLNLQNIELNNDKKISISFVTLCSMPSLAMHVRVAERDWVFNFQGLAWVLLIIDYYVPFDQGLGDNQCITVDDDDDDI